jgi:hypothetical protein
MRASAFVIFARGTRGDTGRPERDLARPPVCLLSAFSWRKIGEDFFFQAVSNPPRCMACVMTFSVLLCLRVAGGWTAEREIGSPADGDLDQVKQVHGTHAKNTRESESEREETRERERVLCVWVCVSVPFVLERCALTAAAAATAPVVEQGLQQKQIVCVSKWQNKV